MACVNVNDKGFKATSKRLNIHPKTLEGVIDGYWVANPTLELNQEFPSDQYILETLKLGGVSSTLFSSLLEYENAHKLWEKQYSDIRTFNNPFDAKDYYYLVSQLFGKSNVGVIPRVDNTLDVTVLEPQKNIPSEPIITKKETSIIKDSSGKELILYRGYALTENREADNIEETIGKTAVDYDKTLKGAIYFTNNYEEALDYALGRTDKSDEVFIKEGKKVTQRNRHYTGDYAKVSNYYISADASVEYYSDIKDYIKTGKNSTADVIILNQGTLYGGNVEYIVKNKSVIIKGTKEESLAGDIVNSLNQQISGTEDTLSDREIKGIADREAFLSSDIIHPAEREYLAKQTIAMFSNILDQLQGLTDMASSDANELYFKGKYTEVDFSSMSRGAIIQKLGPMAIFNIIKEDFFNPYKREDISDESFDKLELAYLNFETLLDCGYHKLVNNEHISLVGNYNRDINDLDNIDEDNNNQDFEVQGSQAEKYQIRAKSISVRESLSPLIRRAFDKLKEKDENGLVVIDQFGLPKLMDSDTVYNTILASVRKATTIELMESILAETVTINPWMKEVLELIKKEPFRSQFYQNFRKDFSIYSIITRELDDLGNYTFRTHIINTNDLSKTILSTIGNLLNSGELAMVYNVDPISGYGTINPDIVNATKTRLDVIMAKFKVTNKQFSKEDLNKLADLHYKEVSSILQTIGISLNDVVIRNILAGTASKSKLIGREQSVGFKVLSSVESILTNMQTSKNPDKYSLLGKDEDSVKGFYSKIATDTTNYMEQSVESSTYENGKMYYSYVTPSYLGKLVLNLKNSMGDMQEFNKFIEKNYSQFDWFVHDNKHSNEWLRLLSENTENGAKMRDLFDHKVQLHFNGVGYTDLSALDYSISLMQEFFADFSKVPTFAWYHVPILADKPSAEFIKFRRYTDNNSTTVGGYEKEIVSQLVKVAKLELRRMKTVKERSSLDIEKIHSFDEGRGSKFQFLDFLNDTFLVNNKKSLFNTQDKELKKGSVVEYNGKKYLFWNESSGKARLINTDGTKFSGTPNIDKLVVIGSYKTTIYNNTEYIVTDKNNIYSGATGNLVYTSKDNSSTTIKDRIISSANEGTTSREYELVQEYLNDNNSNGAELSKLLEIHIKAGMENKFQSALKTWEKIGVLDTTKNPKTEKDTFTHLNNIASTRQEAEKALKNYFYNSYFATTEIIQLTVTDMAYYESTEDFLKRFAQIHSPALRFNVSATDNEGVRYTKDGIERTMYIADEYVTSEILGVVEKMFDDKIKSAKNDAQKKGYTLLRDNIVKGFKGINVTDALAYTTLKGYRKKMGQAGKWTPAMEEAYKRIKSGNMNLSDLDIVCQPMKPFVYTQIAKESYSKVMKLLKMPVQNKNSEYVLIMAGAIAASQGGKVNKLKAISDFMDENDIDTIQFGTAVKSGKMGVIDINSAQSEEEVKNILGAHTFAIDPTTNSRIKEEGNDKYNEQFVHEIPFEDYGIQLEVPEHLMDAFLLFGSLIRKLIMADITPGTMFQVGDTTMTKDALIEEYLLLIAANVENSFNDLVKDLKLDNADLKVKNKAISELLVEEIKTNSRYGPELLRACSLNTEGDFVIPLADPTQSYRIQQLMNSIIKSRITKLKIKGGAVVLVSPYGLSNDLSIIFNEDGSIKYFECYMPAYSKEFLKDFLDENGQLNVEDLPEELRKLIGYRIPTEDKYSMAPLYIKGFLAQESGSAIMLPKEITLLSGSDYDIDKMYVMLPEFDVVRHFNKNAFLRDFKSSLKERVDKDLIDITFSQVVTREGIDGISEGSLDDKMNKFYQANKTKYNTTTYTKTKYDTNLSPISQSTAARNNRLIDLMYSILTNKDTAEKIFNPGSFDTQKKSARIINILKSTRDYTYNDLKDFSIKELDKIIDDSGFRNTKNIVDPTTQVAFHQQNTTAGKLIGIFANHNSSHAIMQLQEAHFNMLEDIVFDGVSFNSIVGSETDVLGAKLDNVYALDGFTYIGKNNAGFLAASVDAVKDPVLNFMNLNTYTANVAMVLSRMGFDPDSIGLLLTQPAIERVTQDYFKKSNENYITSDSVVTEAINIILKELGGGITEKAISDNIATSNFTKQELAKHLNVDNTIENKQYELETLVLFKKLLKMGSDLNELTFITKYDTVSNAVGPTIADSMAKTLRVSKFMKRAQGKKAPFSQRTYDVLENSPLLNSFFRFGNQSSYLLFADNFPHFQADFVAALELLRDSTKADIDVKTVNKFMNDFISFKLTKGTEETLVFSGKKEDRALYLLEFAPLMLSILSNPALANNALIKILLINPKNKRNPMVSLSAQVGGLSSDAIESIKNAWGDLYANSETRDIALALFNYNFYRSGFSFSPTSFMHLVPIEVKLAVPNYVSSLRSNSNQGIFDMDIALINSFVQLFKRNYTLDRRIVPNIDSSKLKIIQGTSGFISVSEDENAELDKIIVSDTDTKVYADMITVTDVDKNKNIVETFYMNVSSQSSLPQYKRISPLGFKNNALEYSFNPEDVDVSVIPENLKARMVTSNPDNVSGMDTLTMDKVYKEHTGVIDEILSITANLSTELAQEMIGVTKDRKSKVIKVLRASYPNFESMDGATKTKLINYIMNSKIRDASGEIIC